MQLIGSREQRLIDEAWQQKTGLPLLILMEAAARAVVRVCQEVADLRHVDFKMPVLILCGPGQNGGDAYACARLLSAEGFPVRCLELFKDAKLPDEALQNRKACMRLNIDLSEPDARSFADLHDGLIIDGIFGSGFSAERGVPDCFRKVSRWVDGARKQNNQVLAIDIPSGLDGNTGLADPSAIQADRTVTFVRPKPGLVRVPGRFLAGKVTVDPIGIDPELVEEVLANENLPKTCQIDAGTVRPWCPQRPPDGHKGLFGRLLMIGGSDSMPGAVVLAAKAALRSGLGLLQLAVPRSIRDGVLLACPEALQLPIGPAGPQNIMQEAVLAASAVAVGPGIGRPPWLSPLLDLLIACSKNLVIDADALNEISRDPQHFWERTRQRIRSGCQTPAVLTPHPGEFSRLAPDLSLNDRQKAAIALAERSGCMVVLKGADTIVAEPDGHAWINTTGQDGLSRGGSGDLLTGLIAGLMAQGLSPLQAACSGVFFHGLAGDLAAATYGRRAMLLSDVLEKLGSAWHQAGWEVEDV